MGKRTSFNISQFRLQLIGFIISKKSFNMKDLLLPGISMNNSVHLSISFKRVLLFFNRIYSGLFLRAINSGNLSTLAA